jgi:hypothetical protein
MAFLLDANVFLQAKNQYYGFDVCPGFWDWLEAANAAARVFSIVQVRDELAGRTDEVAEWADRQGERFFLEPDAVVLTNVGRLNAWAAAGNYRPAAVAEFLRGADAMLVAHAARLGYVVVTHELPPNGVKSVKIPEACVALGVQYTNTFGMLRRERARFVLPPQVQAPLP